MFYNITPGGPHIEGFKLSNEEKARMYSLKNQLDNENIYGMKVGFYITPVGKRSEHIELIEVIPRRKKCYISKIFNNYTNKDSKGKIIDRNQNFTAPEEFKELPIEKINTVDFLHINGYQPISELEFYITKNVAEHSDEWEGKLEDIRSSNKLYFEKMEMDSVCINKTKQTINTKNITTIKNDSSLVAMDDNDTIMYIKEHANTSKDIDYLLKLYEEYNYDLGFAAIFNAVTGLASVPPGYIKTKFECSFDQYNKARAILDYEKRFVKIANEIKKRKKNDGFRKDYFFAAISFCYECEGRDANRLFNKIKENYKDLKEVKSIKSFICWITNIYNHYLSPDKKIRFDLKYDVWKSKQQNR